MRVQTLTPVLFLLALVNLKQVLSQESNGKVLKKTKEIHLQNKEEAILSEEVMTNESIFPQSRSLEPQNFVKKIKKFKTNKQEEPANTKKVKKLIKKKKIVSSAMPRAPTTAPTFSPSDSFQTEQPFNRSNEDSRFLSLFTVVRFRNEACLSGTGSNGTCFSARDCSDQGGISSGACAQGFGVCCIFSKTCGQSTNSNGTYFQNEGYPSSYSTVGSCQLTINKCSDSVCQVRLDFQNLVLGQPDVADHQCRYDQFIVSGGSSPVPAICGTNTGQHMYVDMGLAYNNPLTLTVVSSGSATSARSFSMRVTQLECTKLTMAPDGCLQYYQGVTGTIVTFNYMEAAGLMLSNTDYSICIRSERNFCGVQYTACADTTNERPLTPFQLNTPSSAMSFSITGSSQLMGSIVGTNCATDWIQIPCATNTMDVMLQLGTPAVCVDRICGMVFNSVTTPSGTAPVPVNSYVKPFIVHVHTNAVEGSSVPAEVNNRGFCLKYVQQPCTSTG